MGKFIPNENSWVAVSTTRPANLAAPLVAELTAATRITKFIMSLDFSAAGNTVPTPDLENLFETSVPGTSAATATADMYRDDASGGDTAWEMLPRGALVYFYLSRFGGTGTNHKPVAAQNVEVWPIRVTSRKASALTNNTVMSFSMIGAVPEQPVEDAVVAA